MITWMTGKNSMKHYYLKWKIFKVTLNMEDITDADYAHAKKSLERIRNKKFRRI